MSNDTVKVRLFRAARDSHRWRANQKVWIELLCANHMYVRFRWRGRGRYVRGIVDRFTCAVGEIKTIGIDRDFAERHSLEIVALDPRPAGT